MNYKRCVDLLFTPDSYEAAMQHLYRGDYSEHAGALLCGLTETAGSVRLMVRSFVPAVDGRDYLVTEEGHGSLQPLFIDGALDKAMDESLVYVAVHNHFSHDQVGFSRVDMTSHERCYPTLLALAAGRPVGAAVFGLSSIEVDLWFPDGRRCGLKTARVIGHGIRHLWASPKFAPKAAYDEKVDRQLPFLRASGQGLLRDATIVIVGVGGIGSQLVEPLTRLGVRRFILIDPDRLDTSNYSRVHGALPCDLPDPTLGRLGELKVKIAKRAILAINPEADVKDIAADVARGDTYTELLAGDFVFLAADTPEARFVCNAVCHQHFIPTTQLGTKVVIGDDGSLQGIFGAVRQIRPGRGCLWCNGLIDRVGLANAAKPKEQVDRERYGTPSPNPAVVTFNSEVAALALNEFLLAYASPQVPLKREYDYSIVHFLEGEREQVSARRDLDCPFCSSTSATFAAGTAETVQTLPSQ
jgi:molybdopterin/thiamine biosynthesis adenylyltransferase